MAAGTSPAVPATKRIIVPQFLPNAAALLYTFQTTNPVGFAQVTSILTANQNTVPVAVTLYLVPLGQSVATQYIVYPAVLIPASTVFVLSSSADAEIMILDGGDMLWGFASVASSIVITASDREYS